MNVPFLFAFVLCILHPPLVLSTYVPISTLNVLRFFWWGGPSFDLLWLSFFFNTLVGVMHGAQERRTPGNALAVSADKPFRGLSQFGTGFLSKLECSQCPSPILEVRDDNILQRRFFCCFWVLTREDNGGDTPPPPRARPHIVG